MRKKPEEAELALESTRLNVKIFCGSPSSPWLREATRRFRADMSLDAFETIPYDIFKTYTGIFIPELVFPSYRWC